MIIKSFLFTLWLALIALISLSQRGKTAGSRWSLFRALIPSWRFFDRIEHLPVLFFRIREPQSSFGEWRKFQDPKPRAFSALVFNPFGNLQLAYHAAIDHLIAVVNGAQNPDDVYQSSAYQIVQQMLEFELRPKMKSEVEVYQFKISVFESATLKPVGDSLLSIERELRCL